MQKQLTEAEAIALLEHLSDCLRERIKACQLTQTSWSLPLYEQRFTRARSQIRALRGDCKISRQLVMDAIHERGIIDNRQLENKMLEVDYKPGKILHA